MFSIIMPAFNSEKYILDAVESVIRQSYEDWELLIVDDSSTDSTLSLLKYTFSNEPRIKILSNKFKKGASGARNTGIETAQYRYISFLDSDDMWQKDKLRNQFDTLVNKGAKLVYSNYYVIDNKSSMEKLNVISSFVAPPTVDLKSMLKTCSIGCLTATYDSNFFGKVYFPDSPKEDYALWLILIDKCERAFNSGHFDAYYRITPGSISSNKFREIGKQLYVIRNYGRVTGFRIFINILFYICYGLIKYRR